MFTKSQLLKTAKANGFTGTPEQLTAQWFSDRNIEFQDTDGSVADVAAILAKKTVTVTADAGEVVKVNDGSTPAEGEMEAESMQPKSISDDEAADYRRLKAKETAELRKNNKMGEVAARGSILQSPEGMARYSARKHYNIKANAGRTNFADAELAEKFNAHLRVNISEHTRKNYAEKKNDLEIIGKTWGITNNDLGATLVPDDFISTLMWSTEPVGVARRLANVVKMNRDVVHRPRLTSIPAMAHVSASGAITASDAGSDAVTLTAKKAGVILKFQSELMEDSAISIGDAAGNIIREAYDIRVDSDYFLGDGTSTYGGHVGLIQALPSGAYINGAGATWASLTLANILTVIGSVENVDPRRLAMVCSRQFAWQVLKRLDTASSQFRELFFDGQSAGAGPAYTGPNATFMGLPVYYSQLVQTTSASAKKSLYVGDFAGASMIGERRDLSVESSDQYYWNTDEIGIKATARFNIAVHGDGRASTYGPVASLLTT